MARKKQNIEELKAKAEGGDPIAQNELGLLYAKGDGIEKDLFKAKKLFYKSAIQGCADAQFHLGWCYESGKGTEPKPKEAFKWYQKASNQEHAIAQYFLSQCYNRGIGTKSDNGKWIEYLRKSAENGYGYAQLLLGRNCFNGYSSCLNKNEAYHWFNLSSKKGYEESRFYIGRCLIEGIGVNQNVDRGIKFLSDLATKGHSQSAIYLGYLYEKDGYVKADRKQMEKWYMHDYELGQSWGMTNLGKCYEKGILYDINIEKAVECYKLAADRKNYQAMGNLTRLYKHGKFSLKDSTYVIKLLNEMHQMCPDPDTAFEIGEYYFYGLGVEINYNKAFYWFSHGVPESSYMLAICYRFGYGTVVSETKSYELMHEAANYGDIHALKELTEYYIYGIGTAQDYKEAYIVANICHAQDHKLINDDVLKELKSHLSVKDIDDAENQAYDKYKNFEPYSPGYNLNKVIREKELPDAISDDTLFHEIEPFDVAIDETAGKGKLPKKPKTKEDHIAEFKAWNVTDFSNLNVVYNLTKNYLKFTYDGKSKSVTTIGSTSVFSVRFIAMIEAYYRLLNKELDVERFGHSIGDLCGSKCTNDDLKNYVNDEMRKVFGIASGVQVFQFKGDKPHKFFTTRMKIEVI
ncbi:MAG: sel1 repeat family protein [Candidatus Cloacimonetes bacterium]|nr:sel1 repeat family protein [Candidatus Cloacimonadota bacterium]MDY0367290.1 tetratricopeptide repeat protein [Candidatus Syntrophosphaera sp.]